MKKSNRISFSKYDSNHLYELSIEHFQKGCFVCDKLKKHLQDFIGIKDVRQIKNSIRKNSYCKKDKFFKSYSKSDKIYD